MGYRYHASATFPAIARKVAEISQYLDDDSLGYEVTEEDDLIIVACQDANCGVRTPTVANCQLRSCWQNTKSRSTTITTMITRA